MKNVVIINGPNLNILGKREINIYGNENFKKYLEKIKHFEFFKNFKIKYYQSNSEGKIINKLQDLGFNKNINGIILNAGAYSHTSLAIADSIKSIFVPVIEVHITNIYSREYFRHKSYISQFCKGVICGFGLNSYKLALISLLDI